MAHENQILYKGPALIDWDGGAFLFITAQGGVTATDEQLVSDVMEDSSGLTPVTQVTTGHNCEIVATVTRPTLEALGTMTGATVQGTTDKVLNVSNSVGYDKAQDAAELIIKPMIDGVVSTDDTTWLTFFKVLPPRGNFSWVFDAESQRVYPLTFKPVPDASNNLYKIGTTIT